MNIPDLTSLITVPMVSILNFLCSNFLLSFSKFKMKQKKPDQIYPLTNIGDTYFPGSVFDFVIPFLFSKEWSSSSRHFDSVLLKGY